MTQQYWCVALFALRFASQELNASLFVRRPQGQHGRDGPGYGHRLSAHRLAFSGEGGVEDIPRPPLSGADGEAVCKMVPHYVPPLLRCHFCQLALALCCWKLLQLLKLVRLDPPLLRDMAPAEELAS